MIAMYFQLHHSIITKHCKRIANGIATLTTRNQSNKGITCISHYCDGACVGVWCQIQLQRFLTAEACQSVFGLSIHCKATNKKENKNCHTNSAEQNASYA